MKAAPNGAGSFNSRQKNTFVESWQRLAGSVRHADAPRIMKKVKHKEINESALQKIEA
jgi:hypothetical protein